MERQDDDVADEENATWRVSSRTIATLVFPVGVRSAEYTGAGNCALSYAKAAVWSAIWPAS
jgi:hypothetical protein